MFRPSSRWLFLISSTMTIEGHTHEDKMGWDIGALHIHFLPNTVAMNRIIYVKRPYPKASTKPNSERQTAIPLRIRGSHTSITPGEIEIGHSPLLLEPWSL